MHWSLPALILGAAPLHNAQPPDEAHKDLVKVAVVQRDRTVKPGETTLLGFTFTIKKDWHIYWPGQNDSGTPTTIAITPPKGSGVTAGPIAFPTPKRHLLPGDILDYVLEGTVTLTLPITVPASAKPGQTLPITAQVDYLVCKESCIPGEATLSTTITVAETTTPDPASAHLFAAAAKSHPKPQSEGFETAFGVTWSGDTLTLTASDPKTTRLTFSPADGGAKLLQPAKTGSVSGKTLTLAFEPGAKPAAGVVELTTGNTSTAWTFSLHRPAPITPKHP